MLEATGTIAAAAAPAILVAARIGGIAIFVPGLSSSAVPARVRFVLAVALGAAIFPAVAARTGMTSFDELHLFALAPLIVLEVALGAAIGFLAALPLSAAHAGGWIAGQQLGVGFAQLFNPALDDETDVLGQLFLLMALAAFLLMGGLEHTLLAVMHSFEYVPAGEFAPRMDLATVLAGVLLASLELALRIAAPLLALVLLETVLTGFLARSIPPINILSFGFAVRILTALTLLGLGLAATQSVMIGGIGVMLESMHAWATGSS